MIQLFSCLFLKLIILQKAGDRQLFHLLRVSLEEWGKMKGQTDWEKVKAMTEEEISENAWSDPDNQPTSDEFWDDAVVVSPSDESVTTK